MAITNVEQRGDAVSAVFGCTGSTNSSHCKWPSIPRVPLFFCGTFHDGPQRAAFHRSCSASQAATTALVVATTSSSRSRLGHVYSPLSPTETEEGQRRVGGERVALHGQGPEDSSSPAVALLPVRRRARRAEQLVDEPVPSFDDFELVQVGEEEEVEHLQVVPGVSRQWCSRPLPGCWSGGGLLVDDRHIHCQVDPL